MSLSAGLTHYWSFDADPAATNMYADLVANGHLTRTIIDAGVLRRNSIDVYPKVPNAAGAEGVAALSVSNGNLINNTASMVSIVSDRLTLSYNYTFKGRVSGTGNMWMFHDGITAGTSGLLRGFISGTTRLAQFRLSDAVVGTTIIANGFPMATNSINRITLVLKRPPTGYVKIYVNRSLAADTTINSNATLSTGGPFRILTRDALATDFGGGVVDEFGIWHRELSTQEIALLQGEDPFVFRDGAFRPRSAFFLGAPYTGSEARRPTEDLTRSAPAASRDILDWIFPKGR